MNLNFKKLFWWAWEHEAVPLWVCNLLRRLWERQEIKQEINKSK